MAIRSYKITVGTTPLQLSSAIAAGDVVPSFRSFSAQSDTTATQPFYIGGSDVSRPSVNNIWLWRIPGPVTSEPSPPLQIEAKGSSIADLWVVSDAAGQILHFGGFV